MQKLVLLSVTFLLCLLLLSNQGIYAERFLFVVMLIVVLSVTQNVKCCIFIVMMIVGILSVAIEPIMLGFHFYCYTGCHHTKCHNQARYAECSIFYCNAYSCYAEFSK